MKKQIILMSFVFLLLLPNLIFAQFEEKIILQTVQQFFDVLESRDTTMARSIFLPDGQFFSIRENESNNKIKRTTHSNFIKELTTSNKPMREIMQDSVVLIERKKNGKVSRQFEY